MDFDNMITFPDPTLLKILKQMPIGTLDSLVMQSGMEEHEVLASVEALRREGLLRVYRGGFWLTREGIAALDPDARKRLEK